MAKGDAFSPAPNAAMAGAAATAVSAGAASSGVGEQAARLAASIVTRAVSILIAVVSCARRMMRVVDLGGERRSRNPPVGPVTRAI